MEHANPAILVLIVLFVGPVLIYIWRATRGENIYVRRIPGIDAIDEAIGRAVELGRPLSFTSGITGISPVLYACLGVLRHIARRAAVYGSRLFVPSSDPEALVLTDATLQNAYRTERKFSKYDPTTLRFLSEEQFAYASGYMGLITRENVASAFLFGNFAAESLILAEAGQKVGALQVAATVSAGQIPFFITSCDYTLIGEELYAAGAYLSRDPVLTGSLKGQDIAKLIIILMLIMGILMATAASVFDGQVGEPVALERWIQASWTDLLGTPAEAGQ